MTRAGADDLAGVEISTLPRSRDGDSCIVDKSGSFLLENRYDIGTIQELFGHRDVSTTMIYTHVLNRGGMEWIDRRTAYDPK